VENYKIELPNFYHQPNKAQRKGIIKNHTVSKPTKKKKKSEREAHTELGEEEKEYEREGHDCDNATGEGTAVEILLDFRVGIQFPELVKDLGHGHRTHTIQRTPSSTKLSNPLFYKDLSLSLFCFLSLHIYIRLISEKCV
jgi:hypothetical protein